MECNNYIVRWWHFLIPSFYIFTDICTSYDKTKLFIVSCVRLLIYIFFLKLIGKYYNPFCEFMYISICTLICVSTYVIINILYINNKYKK